MDILIPWLCVLKNFQSKEKHNYICCLKKLKHSAFP